MTYDFVALGWQIIALVVAGLLVFVVTRFLASWEGMRVRNEQVTLLSYDLAKLRADTTAWLNDQRTAHAKILEDHLNRLKALEPSVGVLSARVSSLEQVNEVMTKEPQSPGAIGPFLRNRKAGTT